MLTYISMKHISSPLFFILFLFIVQTGCMENKKENGIIRVDIQRTMPLRKVFEFLLTLFLSR